jgi:hypothetical protein
MKPLPSQDYLREWLDYDPATGLFRWKKQPGTDRPLVGRIAGTPCKGYIALHPGDGNVYQAHRLAWVWMNGKFPPELYIDHIDGDRSNNAIANLRLATARQNQHNKRRNRNSSLKGVKYETSPTHRSQRKWRSSIMVDGKRIDLGGHLTPAEAHQAYCDAATKYFGDYARFE